MLCEVSTSPASLSAAGGGAEFSDVMEAHMTQKMAGREGKIMMARYQESGRERNIEAGEDQGGVMSYTGDVGSGYHPLGMEVREDFRFPEMPMVLN
jgi:hypothetical protein